MMALPRGRSGCGERAQDGSSRIVKWHPERVAAMHYTHSDLDANSVQRMNFLMAA
jgi:hypothetical protein